MPVWNKILIRKQILKSFNVFHDSYNHSILISTFVICFGKNEIKIFQINASNFSTNAI